MKKINPCISNELYYKILKDPTLCEKMLLQERAMAIKLQRIVMKHLCSKEFLEGIFKEDNNEKIRIN